MRGHNKLDGYLVDRMVVCINELDSYFVPVESASGSGGQ
jgi:hypothetical protein